jgi:hypothetical protein
MGGFWDHDLGMEDECQRIMESIRGEEANKGRNPGANGGRIWVCCLSYGRMAVLVRQGWVRVIWTETRAGGKREERIRGQRMRKLRAQERGDGEARWRK